MANANIQGILTSLQLASETTTVLVPYLREIFINEVPLFARLPHMSVSAPEYNILSYDVRQRQVTLASTLTAVSALTVATVTFNDVSQMQQGDVIEIYNTGGTAFERAEVQADPNTANNTVSLMRGVEGTTPIANDNSANTTAYIMGNSRTGAEVNQTASRAIRNPFAQYVQTYQFPVQVGGLAEAIESVALPPGISDVFSMEQKVKMTEFVRDVEFTGMYGLGQSAGVSGATQRRKQKGLRTQIANYKSTGSGPLGNGPNYKFLAGGSYTKLNFIADTVQKVLDAGGNPDVMLCSTDFTTGLATWSVAQQYFMNPRQTPYLGIAIREFDTAFTGQPMTIIPSFQLRKGTVVVLTSSDLMWRYIRPAFFQKRGLRGDAWEGDFIGDYAIEAGHQGWHAWCEGITSFA